MTNLILSLQITALGMGLVFGAILLLWLMMVLLTLFTADKDTSTELSASPASDSPDSSSPLNTTASIPETNFKLQAVALAVAIALAEQGQSTAHPLPDPPTAIVSAWQLGMRTRQSSEKGNFRRH